jgi:SAM-dependent methyltransferase
MVGWRAANTSVKSQAQVSGRSASWRMMPSRTGWASAEYIAALGFDTTAFDAAGSAIQAARQRFPGSPVRYLAANVMTPPPGWREGFDLVAEVYTLQVLPEPLRRRAITQIGHLVRPGGTLIVIARAAAEDGRHPPWPLTRAEIEAFTTAGLRTVRIENVPEPQAPAVRRWRAEFTRPRQPNPERPPAPPNLRSKAFKEPQIFAAGHLLCEASCGQPGLTTGSRLCSPATLPPAPPSTIRSSRVTGRTGSGSAVASRTTTPPAILPCRRAGRIWTER